MRSFAILLLAVVLYIPCYMSCMFIWIILANFIARLGVSFDGASAGVHALFASVLFAPFPAYFLAKKIVMKS